MVILGDGTVGKTSFSLRVAEDKFTSEYKQTVGVDFFLRKLKLPGMSTFVVTKLLSYFLAGNTELFHKGKCVSVVKYICLQSTYIHLRYIDIDIYILVLSMS